MAQCSSVLNIPLPYERHLFAFEIKGVERQFLLDFSDFIRIYKTSEIFFWTSRDIKGFQTPETFLTLCKILTYVRYSQRILRLFRIFLTFFQPEDAVAYPALLPAVSTAPARRRNWKVCVSEKNIKIRCLLLGLQSASATDKPFQLFLTVLLLSSLFCIPFCSDFRRDDFAATATVDLAFGIFRYRRSTVTGVFSPILSWILFC